MVAIHSGRRNGGWSLLNLSNLFKIRNKAAGYIKSYDIGVNLK
jgi:hypothetical protein